MIVNHEIPTLQHTIDGRRNMRSIADALEALRVAQRLVEGSLLEVRTCPLRLPSGEEPYMVFVTCRVGADGAVRGVALPTSSQFAGKREGTNRSGIFDICLLDRGRIDTEGIVELLDGTRLHAVEVIPMRLPWKLTDMQKRIVYWTIKLVRAENENKCYRYGPASPGLEWLDYATLYGLALPSLKTIQRYIYEQDPTLRELSRQTIANALGACGMRRPRSGRLAV